MQADIIIIIMIFFFFVIPMIIALHEIGHVVAVKLMGGKVIEAHLTNGTPLFKWKNYYVGLNFMSGSVIWDLDSVPSKYKRAFISAGGALATGTLFLVLSLFYPSPWFLTLNVFLSNLFNLNNSTLISFEICLYFTLMAGTLAPLLPLSKRADGYHIYKHLKQVTERECKQG